MVFYFVYAFLELILFDLVFFLCRKSLDPIYLNLHRHIFLMTVDDLFFFLTFPVVYDSDFFMSLLQPKLQ